VAGYPSSKPYVDKSGDPPKGFENQCAIKVSVALHAAGVDMKSFRGAAVTVDGKRLAIRAEELAAWLKTGLVSRTLEMRPAFCFGRFDEETLLLGARCDGLFAGVRDRPCVVDMVDSTVRRDVSGQRGRIAICISLGSAFHLDLCRSYCRGVFPEPATQGSDRDGGALRDAGDHCRADSRSPCPAPLPRVWLSDDTK
jgi:hypothetical protein